MKKAFLLLAVVLAILPVFAADNVFFANGSPFGVHMVKTEIGTSYTSSYGWGASVGYRHYFGSFLVGTEASYLGFKNDGARDFTIFQAMAKIGVKVALGNKFVLNGDIGGGYEVAISSTTNYLPVVGAGISMSCYVKESLAITCGVNASMAWPYTQNSIYKARVLTINPTVGIAYNF